MQPDFTPAAWRVLTEAARWTSFADEAPLDLPELLLGLLAEEECRAAALLASGGIDAAAVRLHWPALRFMAEPPAGRTSDFSLRLHAALAESRNRLHELPQPLALATEHLLLGILAVPSEASAWLVQHGLSTAHLAAQIFRWEGVSRGPLESAECGVRIAESHKAATGGRGAAPQEHPPASGFAATHSAIRNPQSAMFRLLDASANRAREALRVLEDYVRFVLNDRRLSCSFKSLRHELAQLLSRLPAESLLSSRDTLGDVGTSISTATERTRTELKHVLSANFKRLQESLRSLEEYSKLIDPHIASGLEQLRYQAYTLEQQVQLPRGRRELLNTARLYVLIDGRESIDAFEQLARSLIAADVHVLQLRDKRLADCELLDRARRLRHLTQGTRTLFIMNDRPDLASLSQADGVHVGQEELTVDEARAIVGPQALIGVSTHSIEQARQAVLDGADYIGVGPTFPSGTKQFAAFPGLDLLRGISSEIREPPAFAIGGITLENLPEALATGITRIAVSGSIASAPDPAAAAREFLRRLPSV